MSNQELIYINPNDLMAPVHETVGEGMPHVDNFTDMPGFEWATWCQEKSKMLPLIREPLLSYWRTLNPSEQLQLKRTVQYILNVDEDAAYVIWKFNPNLKKKSGVGSRYFANYQDTIQPHDWYEFCLWLWEILFNDEDWHTDVSGWVVTDKATLYKHLGPENFEKTLIAESQTIVDPNKSLAAPVYAAVGEGTPHVDSFTSHPDFEWRSWTSDRNKVIPLIRAPLKSYWEELDDVKKRDLKCSLQYLLNIDEFAPYEEDKYDLSQRKVNSLTQKIFNSFQDTALPGDGYAFCLWMWEVLFPGEDWHTNISEWRCIDKTPRVSVGTFDQGSLPPRPQKPKLWLYLFWGAVMCAYLLLLAA